MIWGRRASAGTEALARFWFSLCRGHKVQQEARLDRLSLDLLPLTEDGLRPAEVDVGGGEFAWALVVALMVVVLDEGSDLRRLLVRVANLGAATFFTPER